MYPLRAWLLQMFTFVIKRWTEKTCLIYERHKLQRASKIKMTITKITTTKTTRTKITFFAQRGVVIFDNIIAFIRTLQDIEWSPFCAICFLFVRYFFNPVFNLYSSPDQFNLLLRPYRGQNIRLWLSENRCQIDSQTMSSLQGSTVQCNLVHYSTIHFKAVQCSKEQLNTVQYNALSNF